MKKEYDFSKGRRNPYAARLKRQVTSRLDEHTIKYFKTLSEESGSPYQTLINLYLPDCAATQKKRALAWKSAAGAKGRINLLGADGGHDVHGTASPVSARPPCLNQAIDSSFLFR